MGKTALANKPGLATDRRGPALTHLHPALKRWREVQFFAHVDEMLARPWRDVGRPPPAVPRLLDAAKREQGSPRRWSIESGSTNRHGEVKIRAGGQRLPVPSDHELR
jgi:hypothetical protein